SQCLLSVAQQLRPRSPLFPYTTLFRSGHPEGLAVEVPQRHLDGRPRERVALHAAAHLEAKRLDAGRVAADEPGRDVALEHDLHRSEEHTSELQSRVDLVCRLLLEKKKK